MVQCSEPWLLVERPVKERLLSCTDVTYNFTHVKYHSAPMAAPTYVPEFRLHL